MTANGVFPPSDLLDTNRISVLFVKRLAALPPGTNAFATMPLGLLSGPFSILDDLRAWGAGVTVMS
jgi:hypothetical protein